MFSPPLPVDVLLYHILTEKNTRLIDVILFGRVCKEAEEVVNTLRVIQPRFGLVRVGPFSRPGLYQILSVDHTKEELIRKRLTYLKACSYTAPAFLGEIRHFDLLLGAIRFKNWKLINNVKGTQRRRYISFMNKKIWPEIYPDRYHLSSAIDLRFLCKSVARSNCMNVFGHFNNILGGHYTTMTLHEAFSLSSRDFFEFVHRVYMEQDHRLISSSLNIAHRGLDRALAQLIRHGDLEKVDYIYMHMTEQGKSRIPDIVVLAWMSALDDPTRKERIQGLMEKHGIRITRSVYERAKNSVNDNDV